jgi:hypothetical protein
MLPSPGIKPGAFDLYCGPLNSHGFHAHCTRTLHELHLSVQHDGIRELRSQNKLRAFSLLILRLP